MLFVKFDENCSLKHHGSYTVNLSGWILFWTPDVSFLECTDKNVC